MRNKALMLSVLAACLVFAGEDETKIEFNNLPPAVQKTAKEQSKGATVRGYSREVEHGKTFYEVELLLDGKTKDVLMDSAGGVVEVEEQIAFELLPDAVKSTLAKQGKVSRVEKVTRTGAVSYEALVSANGKRREIAVTEDGSLGKPE
jgi:hypothetical protein